MNKIVVSIMALSLIICCLLVSCQIMQHPAMLGTMAEKTVTAPAQLFMTTTAAPGVTFRWKDANVPTTLLGFRLYIYALGCTTKTLATTIFISGGALRAYTIKNFSDTYPAIAYTFHITALTRAGKESSPSNNVSMMTN